MAILLDSGAYHANGCIKKRLDIKPDEAEQIVLEAMKNRIESLVIAKHKKSKPDTPKQKLSNLKLPVLMMKSAS